MRSLLTAAFVSTCLTPLVAQTQVVDPPATCKLEAGSIQGYSASGTPQVSNLAKIRIRCSIPSRPLPSPPGESLNGLRAEATAHVVAKGAQGQAFAVEVKPTGGGSGDGRDWVLFVVLIPLKPADLDAEAHRYLTTLMEKVETSSLSSQLASAETQRRMLEVIRETIYQK